LHKKKMGGLKKERIGFVGGVRQKRNKKSGGRRKLHGGKKSESRAAKQKSGGRLTFQSGIRRNTWTGGSGNL